jgi:hypothetical protein
MSIALNKLKSIVRDITYNRDERTNIAVFNKIEYTGEFYPAVYIKRIPRANRLVYLIERGIGTKNIGTILQYILILQKLYGHVELGKLVSANSSPTFVVNCADERDLGEVLTDVWNGVDDLDTWFKHLTADLNNVKFTFSFPKSTVSGDPTLLVTLSGMAEVILSMIFKNVRLPGRCAEDSDLSSCYFSSPARWTLRMDSSPHSGIALSSVECDRAGLGLDNTEPTYDDALVLEALDNVAHFGKVQLRNGIISPGTPEPPFHATLKFPLTDPPKYGVVDPDVIRVFKNQLKLFKRGLIKMDAVLPSYRKLSNQEAFAGVPDSKRISKRFEKFLDALPPAGGRARRVTKSPRQRSRSNSQVNKVSRKNKRSRSNPRRMR